MRRSLPLAIALILGLSACGPAEVVVSIELDVQNPDGEGMTTRPLSEIVVQLVPYDRDAIFDSMTAAFDVAEPPIPAELAAARDEVRTAQEEWQANERRWNTLRDTLQKLNTALDGYSRGESRYTTLFLEWQDFDNELGGVQRAMERSFQRFTDLQAGTIRQSDSIRIMQDNWADEAFADAFDVFTAKQRASGLDAAVDTTDANGVARQHLMVKPGQYWVHARYPLAFSELYWNVPITVERGEPVQVLLNRANAQERPIL